MKVYTYKTIRGLKQALEALPEAKLTYTQNYHILANKGDYLRFIRFFNIRLASEHKEFKHSCGYVNPIGVRVSLAVWDLLKANSKMIEDIAKYI